MPTYWYQCIHCDELTTRTHSIHTGPTYLCSSGKHYMTRRPSAPAVTFKGSGFYRNDSREGV